MILDGAVDPNADPIEEEIRQAAAFQKAFDNYAADCAKSPNCPLGTDPAKAVDVYKSLVDPLVEKPAKTKDPRGLSYSDAIVGTILPLYSPSLWRHLTQALTELKDGTRRHHAARWPTCTWAATRRGTTTTPPMCGSRSTASTSRAITDRAKVVDEDRRAREVAPFMSYGEFTGFAPMDTCAFWPVPADERAARDHRSKGLPPILVVSTTNDPATPYQAGVDLAKQLGGTLVTFDGTQHTVVFQGNTCIDDIAAALPCRRDRPAPEHAMLTIDTVGSGGAGDVSDLLPMLRAYCDFYRVDPSDERLRALVTALIDDPSEGLQLIARDSDNGTPLGFATIYWTWQTLYAARVGVLNDLFVVPASRGTGTGRALIERCRELCRERGAEKLVWETAPDNATAQRLYDGIGAEKSTWLTYELDAR